jgi:hypothetical protein
MVNEVSGSEQYKQEVVEQYGSALKSAKHIVEDARSADTPEHQVLVLGPEITVTDKGRQVRFTSVIVNTEALDKRDHFSRYVLLVGFDSANKLIGHRKIGISDIQSRDYMSATGSTHLLQRNEGYLRYFEVANQDILQRMATKQGKKIKHSVIDSNELKLEEIENERKKLTDSVEDQIKRSDLNIKYQHRKQEHDNWLRMWGPDGKLGYASEPSTDFMVKEFPPSEDRAYNQELENLGMIQLTVEEQLSGNRQLIQPRTEQQIQKTNVNHDEELQKIDALLAVSS